MVLVLLEFFPTATNPFTNKTSESFFTLPYATERPPPPEKGLSASVLHNFPSVE